MCKYQLRILLAACSLIANVSSVLAVAAETRVQFVVAVPLAPPETAQIYVSLSIDGWPAGGRALERVAPGLCAAEFDLPTGVAFEYKFLRLQDWRGVEKGADGGELPNRVLRLGTTERRTRFHVVARWADQPPDVRPASAEFVAHGAGDPSAVRPAGVRTGDIRVHERFASPQLGDERTVLVWLPPGYDNDPQRRFPVLYMHDGQNLFDAGTSFQGVEWGADEAADRLIRTGKLTPIIIVGIYNTPARIAEYTPPRSARPAPEARRAAASSQPVGATQPADNRMDSFLRQGGRGADYLAFVTDTLKPFVDREYRTQPEASSTGIAGSSLGGLISLYAAYRRPDVFGRAAVISPAVWWDDRAILSFVREHPTKPPPRLWIDIGTAEGGSGRMEPFTRAVRDCRDLVEELERSGMVRDRDFRYVEIEGGRHNEAAWAARIEDVLLFLWAPPR